MVLKKKMLVSFFGDMQISFYHYYFRLSFIVNIGLIKLHFNV